MNDINLSPEVKKQVIKMQKVELNGYLVYNNIAKRTKDEKNKEVLRRIALEEKKHAEDLEKLTGVKVKANPLIVWLYTLMSILLGFTFTIKFMERNESGDSKKYAQLEKEVPEFKQIAEDEERHERELLALLDEEILKYVGSMVLGLNDALVELTGTLAGLTFALGNNKIVALSGLITGISATFSMASSEYLSAKSEGRPDALKSCTYTGFAYLVTVALLILPYLLLPAGSALPAFIIMLFIALFIIFAFNFYLSVAQELNFKKSFAEMALISMGVAALSFVVGLAVKHFLGVDI
ncbi:MAG: VIT1/CCC1 transporter family protein [Acutalibacteraceae bacterium]|jgi:VIT1/CCC1 family predicted Fe2+/Mn2+ transporter